MAFNLTNAHSYRPLTEFAQTAITNSVPLARSFCDTKLSDVNVPFRYPSRYTWYNGGNCFLITQRLQVNNYGAIQADSGQPGCAFTSATGVSNITGYDKPAIVCVQYVRFGDYVNSNVAQYRLLDFNDNPTTANDIFALSDSRIDPTLQPDWIIPLSITFWDNSDDGNYSETNPRMALTGYDLAFCANVTEIHTHRNATTDDLITSNIDIDAALLGFTMQFLPPKNVVGGLYTYNRQRFYGELLGYSWTGKCIVGLDSNGDFETQITAFESLSKFQSAIRNWGIPYTFDIDAAQHKNTDDINDDGQPPNPEHDDDGTGDNTVDPMDNVTPTFSPVGAMVHQYVANSTEIAALSNYIFGTVFVPDVRRLWENPGDLIVSCIFYPLDFELHDVTHLSPAGPYKIGNVTTAADVTARAVQPQYPRQIANATIDIQPYYGNFLDYDPYTKIDIYLPYIGYKSLSANDVMRRTLTVNYYVDMTQGQCMAQIYADTRLIGSYTGQCGYVIPMSSTNAVQAAAGAATTAAVGAATIAAGVIDLVATRGAASAAVGAAAGTTTAVGAAKIGIGAVKSTVGVINAASISVDRGGGLPSDMAMYDPQDVYVTITRPLAAIPRDLKNIIGAPASYSGLVGDFNGYLECGEIVGTTPATGAENDKIFEMLRGGIYV